MDEFENDKSLMSGKGEWNEEEHSRDEKGRFISINEFRYIENKNNLGYNHPAHLYAKNDNDDVKFIQLTHSKFISDLNIETKKMFKNPNPKDKREAYILPHSNNGKLSDFGKTKKNWELSIEDENLMKKYRDKPFNK